MNDDIVDCWWEYQRLLRGSPQERKALEAGHPARVYDRWKEATRRVHRGGIPALDLIVALISEAPDDHGVSLVATGPLETLLRIDADAVIDEIGRIAQTDARFRQALADVWIDTGAISPDIAQRLRALTSAT